MLLVKLLGVIVGIGAAFSHPLDDMLAESSYFGGTRWALLVAGSRFYRNYRHQADVYHAYQVVRNHGIPKNNIIVMAYDDIAYNERNWFPGTVLNRLNGPNVYDGVQIDYKGDDITVSNFLNVLQGNAAGVKGNGTNRVINSSKNDHIFLFIDGHGAPGIFLMPTLGFLTAVQLNEALKNMNRDEKYHKMAIYFEACKSGSFFKDLLPNNIKIYSTTAANSTENSFACCFDTFRGAYLGDIYSVNWMADTENNPVAEENLQEQYQNVKNKTELSEVKEFGDISISSDPISEYQGPFDKLTVDSTQKLPSGNAKNRSPPMNDAVDATDVPIMVEFQKLKAAKNLPEKEEIFVTMRDILTKRINMMEKIRKIFDTSAQLSQLENVLWEDMYELRNHDCYLPIVNEFHDKCYDLTQNEYALTYMHKFVTLCENGVDQQDAFAAIAKHCGDEVVQGTI